MPNDHYKSTYDFRVEPFSEDVTGCIAWGQLGNILLRCAQLHAGSRGFGFGPMSKERLSWVFSRLIIDMERRPRRDEAFSVTTWTSEIFRQFTTRLFEVRDGAGALIGHAYSVWALINIDTRQPCDLHHIPGGSFDDYLLPTPDFPIPGPGRIRMGKDAATEAERPVRYSDLDINCHLNSIRALEIALDIFGREQYERTPLRRVEMAYALECFCGEVLSVCKEQKAPGVYDIELRKPGGETAVRAQLRFGEGTPE